MSAAGLDAVLARPDVWRGHRATWAACESTGHARLDAAMDGGWPVGVLIECMSECGPGAEMTLLLPVLKRLMQNGRVVFIDPPHWPYTPALLQMNMALSRLLLVRPASPAEWLWAGVQCLGSGACRMILLWGDNPSHRTLRRLQLAAEDSRALAVLLRPSDSARQASPAALRLAVRSHTDSGLNIDILKCHGRPPRVVHLPDAGPA